MQEKKPVKNDKDCSSTPDRNKQSALEQTTLVSKDETKIGGRGYTERQRRPASREECKVIVLNAKDLVDCLRVCDRHVRCCLQDLGEV